MEVDTRYFINQKYKNDIPTFDLIYSEGKCYIKSYTRKDYDHLIGTRKVEWKRQSKLGYKIQWERLDWFWNALSEYKSDKSKKDSVIESFGAMDISDRVWCYQNIKGKSCVDIKNEFINNINQYYIDKVINLSNKYNYIDVQIEHISPLIYVIVFRSHFEYLGYDMSDSITYKVRSKGKILHPDLTYLEQQLDKFYQEYLMYVQKLSELKQLCQLDYIDSIVPISHKECLNHKIDSVSFRINYIENIHNKYVKESIGQDICYICLITKRKIEKSFDSYKKSALSDLKYELLQEYIYNHSIFQKYIRDIEENFNHYKIDCWFNCIDYYDSGFVILYGRYGHNGLDSQEVELCGPCSDNDDLSVIGQSAYNRSLKILNNLNECMDKLHDLAYEINSCKNKLWTASIIENVLMIKLYSKGNQFISQRISIFLEDSVDDIVYRVYAAMNEMASGLYGNIRLLEVDNGKQG